VSSSGTSTAVSRSPPAGADVGRTVGAGVDVVVTTASATTSCRDPVAATAPSGGSLVAAALSVARGALDECHLVGTDVPDLSALVGARSGIVSATLRTRRQKLSSNPSKPERLEERMLTSRWRSPASSSSRARQALWWRPPSPLQRSRVLAPLPPLRLLLRGHRIPPLRGVCPPSLSSSSPSPDDEYSEVAGGESSCCSHSWYSSSQLFPALSPPDPPFLLARRPLLHPPLRRACDRLGSGLVWVGPRDVYGHPMLKTIVKTASIRCERVRREGRPTHRRGVGEHDERLEVVVAVPGGLEANGAPRPRGRIFLRGRS
jgi:hypothetical protein